MAFLALAGCGKPSDPTETAATTPMDAALPSPSYVEQSPISRIASRGAPLQERFDCLRIQGAMVVAAHRGGPTRDYPENAIETFNRTRQAATRILEVDIAQSRDGVLFLLHDEDLDRLTTGQGRVSDTPWSVIQHLRLKTASTTTDYHPPSLDAALDWAIANDAVLELDKKPSTSFESIIRAVEAKHAETNVVIITYTDAQAIEVARRNPNLMIAATIDGVERLRRLVDHGVKAQNLIAWTGNESPDAELWRELAAQGVESSFGTLGARGDRLDDRFWEDGYGTEYTDLAEAGLSMVSTDFSDKVARALTVDDKAHERCGL